MKMELFLSFLPKLQVRLPRAAGPAVAPGEVQSSRAVEADAGCCLQSPSPLGGQRRVLGVQLGPRRLEACFMPLQVILYCVRYRAYVDTD